LERGETGVVLSVADNGIGIPADDLPHLFERFHRGRNLAEYPGNGLGLAIVKAIVDAHHGRVEAQSTERGSRFTIILPEQTTT
jgi:signal transduction histidine kinase